MFTLSVIAIIYTSLVALMQEDMKKLIAYSSVAHMGFVTMGIFAMNQQGVQGAIFQMLSHGIVSGALFLCVGVVYDRMHTREIAAYGGLVNRMPNYAVAFMVFTMANVGLPGTSRLRRRIPDAARRLPGQHLGGVLRHDRRHPVGRPMRCGSIAGSIFGALARRASKGMLDLSPREKAILVSAGRADDLLRRLSGADPRRDRGIGRRRSSTSVTRLARRGADAPRRD